MNIKLQVIDIYPSIKKLIYNDEETIIFSLTSPKGTSHIFNMLDLIEGNVPIIIRLKDEKDLIKISIYKNELLLGEGEFNYFNDTKWLNLISNDNINNDKMKIKIKCQIEENISNNSSYTINHPSKMYTHKKNYKSSLTNNSKKNLYLEKNNNITLSPNKIKKEKSFKSNFEKKNNSINNKTQNNNSNNRKYSSSKLKHNKSCEEGNLLPQNFLEEENQSNPLYNSMICNKKDINEINNSKINQSHKKIKGKKGIINSLNSTENKSTSSRNYNFVSTSLKENNFITKNTKNNNCKINIKKPNATINITDSGIVKKLDDKFKSIEKQIVDTNFENDLENDEIIDGNKRKVSESLNEKNDKTINDSNSISSFNLNLNIDNVDNENFEFDSEFENLKSDFDIFYTEEYLSEIEDSDIQLEIQLMFEKLFDIQSVYHKEFYNIQKEYYILRNVFKNILKKNKIINKKKFKLLSFFDNIQVENSYNVFVNNYKLKNNKESININKNEFNLWKNMLKCEERDKTIKEIFVKNVLEKYNINNVKNNLNHIQKEICDKLIEKYKITPKLKKPKKENKTNNKQKNFQSPQIKANSNSKKNNNSSSNNNNNKSNNINNNNQYYSAYGNSLKSSFQQNTKTNNNSIKSLRKNLK